MIFVTVGAQMPFVRLVRAVDEWAGSRCRNDVFAQTGPTEWCPENIEWCRFLDPLEFNRLFEKADLIVSHAGMGTILTALQHGKPIVVMPRRGDLRETRNDHQLSCARRFAEIGKIAAVENESELMQRLDAADEIGEPSRINAQASPEILRALRKFVEAGR